LAITLVIFVFVISVIYQASTETLDSIGESSNSPEVK